MAAGLLDQRLQVGCLQMMPAFAVDRSHVDLPTSRSERSTPEAYTKTVPLAPTTVRK
jgi:hypothetical protein